MAILTATFKALKMASSYTGGYNEQWKDSAALLKNFECPVCLLVTREPTLTSCCGQHFCQSCINKVITESKPCPFCNACEFATLLDKKQNRQVLGLKVYCSMKDCGCGWMGGLGELDSHTDKTRGDCQFVDMICPNDCGESVQKRHMDSHCSNMCPKRPFTCKYCKLKSSYKDVCIHYDVCAKFPVVCPNKCEVGSVERDTMSKHLTECPLQVVECEYAHVGCSEKMTRNCLQMHMKENLQQHLLYTVKASHEQIRQLENQLEQVEKTLREKDRQLERIQREKDLQLEAIQRETNRQLEEVRKTNSQQFQEKDQVIAALQEKVDQLYWKVFIKGVTNT